MVEEKRKELFTAYQKWETELMEKCPELINKQYSHPYYLHIPDDWYESQYRILIVGEEGHGEKTFNLPIEEAQEFNRDFLLDQLNNEGKHSPFWRRIWRIAELMKDKGYPYSITWTNLDMIHRSAKNGNCKLKKKDRKALHDTDIKILSKEIETLQPTHVVYFGWYGVSLEKELPDVFTRLYPNGLGDDSQWKDEKMAKFRESGIWHIFTYHPSWGYRQKRDDNGKNYEDKVLNQILETLMQESSDVK